ncbi:exodeoxyribonuclease VII small subunit [Amphritea balenae]|uniref:Exodeoxyribonuclease 7 small subunit n=1 Tax=Amphritea balenae TaxID=452629 RepID=A0A3P1SLW6_9GAMM|nr:exodeoxyribonuclease VII small subunit [Amphritea balenae]RRC97272.1 exodeoxyribonuclease VII small subunit [Amphritea balenae]GGK64700.1 exodeoxyribonuclease 7 small subunit [Amphritea balenae]
MPAKKKTPDFETSLTQLETMVNQLEQGELSLEQSLETFEQGVRLTRDCQSILAQAEQKVQMLIQQNGELKEIPFDLPEE